MARKTVILARWIGRTTLGSIAWTLTNFFLPSQVLGAAVPPGFTDEVYVAGLHSPTAMAQAPDGRIFVCEQGGALRVVKNRVLLTAPFVSLTVSSTGERGLLGVAFDPNFASNQFVYVYYTATSPSIHNRISRFTASGDLASAASEQILMDLETLSATNHNGGALNFGTDGKLYVGVGENAVASNSQTLNNRLGKVLRLNSDGSIPSDNPFFGTATGANRSIWALGLRNPYNFAIQPGTGRILIDDVGQSSFEEINEGFSGANYGWPLSEGPSVGAGQTAPVYTYSHTGGACSIIGAAFYNPAQATFPSPYHGDFFFADYCAGFIESFDTMTSTAAPFATGVSAPVALLVGQEGALYYLASGNGTIGRIRAAAMVPVLPWGSAVLLGGLLSAITLALSALARRPSLAEPTTHS